jgi:hypothetical protein
MCRLAQNMKGCPGALRHYSVWLDYRLQGRDLYILAYEGLGEARVEKL